LAGLYWCEHKVCMHEPEPWLTNLPLMPNRL
jgi:hypothetical protein